MMTGGDSRIGELRGGARALQQAMSRRLRQRIDDVLRAVSGDEEAFNRFAEAERLGVYLRHGRFYPLAIGLSHTGRIARELCSSGTSCFRAAPERR